jgi:hypothetical protein
MTMAAAMSVSMPRIRQRRTSEAERCGARDQDQLFHSPTIIAVWD